MTQYILECIAFQLVFLIMYDFFLKRETFFQWNRVYLIGTYGLSLVLPWIKVEAFKTTLPVGTQLLGNVELVPTGIVESPQAALSWQSAVFFGGMFLAAFYFFYKLYEIYRLRKNGSVQYFPHFTRVIVTDSQLAFSFFRSIFLGDRVLEKDHGNIVQHELVHIRQRHTWDLLFFELMRIVGWFNPLVYVYQDRISELHEFIADSHTAKTHKKEQYQLLLSQVFQTRDISFINPFFKNSLIKKRIVMLQRSRSKKVWQLKYLFLLPVLVGMLFYTSCEGGNKDTIDTTLVVKNIENLSESEEKEVYDKLLSLSGASDRTLTVKDENTVLKFVPSEDGSYISGPNGEKINVKLAIDSKLNPNSLSGLFGNPLSGISFADIDEVPVFPGCEDSDDSRECFQKMIQKHIAKNFRYPEEAQEKGIQGRVYVNFIIDEEGQITNIKKRGPDPLLEEEVERIIGRLPKMTPGKQKGKAVRVPFSVPVTFKLQGDATQSNNNSGNSELSEMHVVATSSGNGKKRLSGMVTDGKNGLPGVTIKTSSIAEETVSDFDGNFVIDVDKGSILSFRYTGFSGLAFTITDQEEYKVVSEN